MKKATHNPTSAKKSAAKRSSKKAVKTAARNYRKQIDNKQTVKLIEQARKAGVNMKAATSVVRFIRDKGFGASNQVIAEMLRSKRAYA